MQFTILKVKVLALVLIASLCLRGVEFNHDPQLLACDGYPVSTQGMTVTVDRGDGIALREKGETEAIHKVSMADGFFSLGWSIGGVIDIAHVKAIVEL